MLPSTIKNSNSYYIYSPIILLALLLVHQHLVGCSEVLELVLGEWIILVLVWVVLFGQPSIGLLDLVHTRFLWHSQDFIEVPPVRKESR